jgi:hypothetical protein
MKITYESYDENIDGSWYRNSSPFMEPEDSILYPQRPAAEPYAEPVQPTSHTITLKSILILLSLYLDLLSGLFPVDLSLCSPN